MSAANSFPAPRNPNRIATALKCLLLVGATLLLAGVLLYCWAELRTASWIVKAINRPPIPPSTPSEYEENDRWHALLDSIDSQHFWASEILMPLGAGLLFGSLAGRALLHPWRFRLSTLFLGILYPALLLGIPFGLVRPRLQNPHISYQPAPAHIRLTQSAPNKFEPKWHSRSEVALLQLKSLPLALTPLLLIPLTVFLISRFSRQPP